MTDALQQGSPSRGHESRGSGAAPHLEASATGRAVSTGSAALRIAIVGPTHPHKGGVAAHTTMLAHHLADAGHDVTLVSWAHLYPSKLHHADVIGARRGQPEVPPFPRTIRALSWARPDTWVRAGRRLRDVDAIVVVHVMPAVARPTSPAPCRRRTARCRVRVDRAVRALRNGGIGRVGWLDRPAPQSVVVCHNVLPHEHAPRRRPPHVGCSSRGSTRSSSTAPTRPGVAHDLGARRVSVADLPPHLPGGDPDRRAARGPVPPACSPSGSSASTRASTCCCAPCARSPR